MSVHVLNATRMLGTDLATDADMEQVTDRDAGEETWIGCVRRIQTAADQSAFIMLFRHFAPRIKGFLIKSGLAEAQAEDCAQEVMATVWHKAHQFDPNRASVATWVFTIARNRKIDLLRRQRRPEPEDLLWGPGEAPDQQQMIELQQDSDRLVEALETLPPSQRGPVERAYFGDLTHSQIAAETGLPLGTIKSRIRLGLERLRHEIGVEHRA